MGIAAPVSGVVLLMVAGFRLFAPMTFAGSTALIGIVFAASLAPVAFGLLYLRALRPPAKPKEGLAWIDESFGLKDRAVMAAEFDAVSGDAYRRAALLEAGAHLEAAQAAAEAGVSTAMADGGPRRIWPQVSVGLAVVGFAAAVVLALRLDVAPVVAREVSADRSAREQAGAPLDPVAALAALIGRGENGQGRPAADTSSSSAADSPPVSGAQNSTVGGEATGESARSTRALGADLGQGGAAAGFTLVGETAVNPQGGGDGAAGSQLGLARPASVQPVVSGQRGATAPDRTANAASAAARTDQAGRSGQGGGRRASREQGQDGVSQPGRGSGQSRNGQRGDGAAGLKTGRGVAQLLLGDPVRDAVTGAPNPGAVARSRRPGDARFTPGPVTIMGADQTVVGHGAAPHGAASPQTRQQAERYFRRDPSRAP